MTAYVSCADGKLLLTASDDMHAHMYDVENAALVEAFSGAPMAICLIFDASGLSEGRPCLSLGSTWPFPGGPLPLSLTQPV
jgi:hypothetical protein